MNDSASPLSYLTRGSNCNQIKPRDGAIDHDVAVCALTHLHTLAFHVLYVNAVHTVGSCKRWKLISYIFTWPTSDSEIISGSLGWFGVEGKWSKSLIPEVLWIFCTGLCIQSSVNWGNLLQGNKTHKCIFKNRPNGPNNWPFVKPHPGDAGWPITAQYDMGSDHSRTHWTPNKTKWWSDVLPGALNIDTRYLERLEGGMQFLHEL